VLRFPSFTNPTDNVVGQIDQTDSSTKPMKRDKIIDSSVHQKVVAGATGLAPFSFLVDHVEGNFAILAEAGAWNSVGDAVEIFRRCAVDGPTRFPGHYRLLNTF